MRSRKEERLSLFSYFGGKARFCKEIAELLDYDHTDVYIEPFGGAASVLLNKPTHEVEIYSDVSRGLVALMTCLSDPEKATELIDCLYDTVYSVDCFNEYLEYRNSVDDNYLKAEQAKELKKRKAFAREIIRRIKKAKLFDELNKLSGDKQLDFIREKIVGNTDIFTEKDIQLIQVFNADEPENLLLGMDSFDLNENVIRNMEEPD